MFSVYTNWRSCLIRNCSVGHIYHAHIRLLYKLRLCHVVRVWLCMPLKQNANLIFIDLNKEAALYTCDVFFVFLIWPFLICWYMERDVINMKTTTCMCFINLGRHSASFSLYVSSFCYNPIWHIFTHTFISRLDELIPSHIHLHSNSDHSGTHLQNRN